MLSTALVAVPATGRRPAVAVGAEAARVSWTLAPATRPGEFDLPHGIAVAPDGAVFVSDAGAHRIQRLSAAGTVETVFGAPGGGDGQLSAPAGLDVGPDGTVWVADKGNGRIAHFDRDGRWLGAWPAARRVRPGTVDDDLPWVTDIVALADGTLVTIGEVIAHHAADGRLLALWEDDAAADALGDGGEAARSFALPGLTRGPSPGHATAMTLELAPTSPRLALDPLRATAPVTTWRNLLLHGDAAPDGTVWVERSPGAVHYDLDGRVIGRVGVRGTSPGMFYRDTDGVGVDAAGNVHLVDTFIDRVQRFAPDGRLLGWWAIGERGTVDLAIAADGSVLLAGGARHRVDRYSADGHRLDRWGGWGSGPGGHVAVGPDGRVVVADPEGGRLQVYRADGRLMALWGATGDGPGRFARPWGQAFIGNAGTLVVTDADLDRIVVLEADGDERGRFGEHGSGESVLNGVRGVAVSPVDHKLAIADPGNHRVAQAHAYGGISHAFQMGFGGLDALTGFVPVDVAVDGPPDGSSLDETLYVADMAGNRILKSAYRGGNFDLRGGGYAAVRPFAAPEALALEAGGRRLFVADTGNDRIQRVATSGDHLKDIAWGAAGRANGQFDRPTGIDVAPDGTVVVHDAGNRRIQRFDAEGRWQDGWPLLDAAQPRTMWPDLSPLADGGFVTASWDPWRLLVFDGAGRRGGAIPLSSPDAQPPQIEALHGAFDGTLWYADRRHRRIVQIDRAGREIRTIAAPGDDADDYVRSFAPAPDGTVYVQFAYPDRVMVYDRYGRLSARWPVASGIGRLVLGADGVLYGSGLWPIYLLRYRTDGTQLESLPLRLIKDERLVDIAPLPDGRLLIVFDRRAAIAESDGYIQHTLWLPGEGCARRSRSLGEAPYLRTVIPLADGAFVASWSTGCLEGWLPRDASEPATWRVMLHPDAFGAEPPVVVTETAAVDLAWNGDAVRPAALGAAPGMRLLPAGGGSATLRRTFDLAEAATLRLDVEAAGGLRVWADDRLLVDRPIVPNPTGTAIAASTAALSMTVSVALAAGRHVVGAVYQAGGDGARVRIDAALGPAPTVTPTASPYATSTDSPRPTRTLPSTAPVDNRRVWLPRLER